MISLIRHADFDDLTPDGEFEVFGVRYSQATGQAGLLEAEIVLPVGGLLSGPRFASLYIDDVRVATGRIAGFPAGLAGDLITVSLECWSSDYSQRVDALYSAISVSEHLVSADAGPRRAEPYVPADVYHPPTSPQPELVPIGGTGDPVAIFAGEGGAPVGVEAFDIFSASFSITGNPIKTLTLNLVADWNQVAAAIIDYGSIVGDVDTFTADEYVAAIKSIATGGAGYTLIEAKERPVLGGTPVVATVTTRRPHTDPVTGLHVGRRVVEIYGTKYQAPEIKIATVIEQMRSETVKLTFSALISEAFNGREEAEEISIADAQRTIAGIFDAHRPFIMPGEEGNFFFQTPVTSDTFALSSSEMQSILNSVCGYAAKRMRTAAHCATVEIRTTGAAARSLTLRDRVAIVDARLPGGAVTGQVAALQWSIGADDLGTVSVRVPVGESADFADPVIYVGHIDGEIAQNAKTINLSSRNPAYFVRSKIVTGKLSDQGARIDEINTQNNSEKDTGDLVKRESETIRRVADYLPKTSITINFRETGTKPEDLLKTELGASVNVGIKKGI